MIAKSRKSPRQPNAQGLVAQAQIIGAAEEVLRRDGYHGFTTRRVAEACGISSGNLAYHFPTKQELLEALVATVVHRYQEEYRIRQKQFMDDPTSAFDSAVRWLIGDSFQRDTGELFVELWVHAKHSKPGAKTIGKLYSTGFNVIEEVIAHKYPESDAQSRRRAARTLTTFIEGAMVLRQTGALADTDFEEVFQSALALVTSLLD